VSVTTLTDWLAPRPIDAPWELAAESIAVKIRWFGLFVGLLLSNFGVPETARWPLNIILFLGFGFTAIDTLAYRAGRVFLRDFPLLISAMESLFIGLLCLFESGASSPFRFYYLLSLICAATRYSPRVTFITCGLGSVSFAIIYASQPLEDRDKYAFWLTLVILVWVTWAAGAMARWLKQASDDLRILNAALRENQAQLETRIQERTRELEDSQAQVLHQEKMAAFGLLAAGIAHEVGNPLTSISSIVQMLEHRDPDAYTKQKLQLVTTELSRIQAILRELITFSRPASDQQGRVAMEDVVTEALRIAKFYKGGKNRQIVAIIEPELPILHGVRDQFVQVVFNLVLNAIDATDKGGRITIRAFAELKSVVLEVSDDGSGIAPEHQERLFRPYFTTKRHGTGLGLFVIRRIVQAHGGEVFVKSTVNEGTLFRVEMPVKNLVPTVGNPTSVAVID
jgi:two-component system, NtrC family, sensor kinase